MGMDNTTRTVKEWADMAGVKPDSARTRATRILKKTIGQTTLLTADEWRTVYPDNVGQVQTVVRVKEKGVAASPAARREPVVKVQPDAPTQPRKGFKWPTISAVRSFALDFILIGIVLGHAGLIWYDCAELWDVPGQIGGGLAFFIILAAVMLATDPTKNITSQIGLFLAGIVDVGAYWVHRPVFESYRVSDEITAILCGFLCGLSFGALLMYRHQKNN